MDMNSRSSTPLVSVHSAVLSGNSEAVSSLIKGGADASQVDCFGKTSLFYAVSHGFEEIVKMLVDAGAPVDDGSLHSAAALCHHSMLSLLLRAGHNPNFLSPLHALQPPLEVVLRHGGGENLRHTLRILHEHGADPAYRKNGKPLLFMALDMDEAGPVVPLLRAFMNKMLNRDFNLFEENSLVYSPLSYVINKKNNVSPKRQEDLIRILRLSGCKEVYYHKTGPQPVGFKNAPGALAWQEKNRDEVLRVDRAISWLLDPEELHHQIRAYESWSRRKDFERYVGFRYKAQPDLY